ncbi:hypothetical protein FHR81_001345 [Actinoalloteichus hoggarensis]|uniref:Uncharacterized protein n=1 Tax=Actinoalloteichus hoggarensis TaxID=1470176 RepID=A0A221VZY6_9PSEU|nr:hypothetical protein [Actinoalloteichus hoggarensis]ASO19077.1 hypothetical protein AHOG_07145 [Actinoalloteichus hoggarensis]MBB5920315.1 hypothetical protein [Actinoalloteichus hoggarensis]
MFGAWPGTPNVWFPAAASSLERPAAHGLAAPTDFMIKISVPLCAFPTPLFAGEYPISTLGTSNMVALFAAVVSAARRGPPANNRYAKAAEAARRRIGAH